LVVLGPRFLPEERRVLLMQLVLHLICPKSTSQNNGIYLILFNLHLDPPPEIDLLLFDFKSPFSPSRLSGVPPTLLGVPVPWNGLRPECWSLGVPRPFF